MTELHTIIEEVATLICKIAISHPIKITILTISSILINIVIAFGILKSRLRYIDWKNRTINILGLWQETWERNDDELLNQLFEENIRIEKENKLLKKQYENQSLKFIILILLVVLSFHYKNILNYIQNLFTHKNNDKSDQQNTKESPLKHPVK